MIGQRGAAFAQQDQRGCGHDAASSATARPLEQRVREGATGQEGHAFAGLGKADAAADAGLGLEGLVAQGKRQRPVGAGETLDLVQGEFGAGGRVPGGFGHWRLNHDLAQEQDRGDLMAAGARGRAGAAAGGQTFGVQRDCLGIHLQAGRCLVLRGQRDLAAAGILAGADQDALVRRRDQRGLVEGGKEIGQPAHAMTSASQSAKASGVSAATLIPSAASSPAMRRS